MSSFVHLNYSQQHPGVVRVESALEGARQIAHGVSSSRSLATLLLSAIAAAIMVAAYQLMDSVAEGHLLVLWIGMWAAAFIALALLANTATVMAASVKTGLDNWSRSLAESRADRRMWAIAKTDPRVMADLQAAAGHQESLAEAQTASFSAAIPSSFPKKYGRYV